MFGRRTFLGAAGCAALPWGVARAQSAYVPPLLCAHRGWRDPSQTENSLAEMQRTTAAGGFMLEMDLAADASGSLVLMHDAAVDRTTDGKGAVAGLTDEQIARLHLRTAQGLTAEAPPHFASVLAWATHTPSALLMLDIKHVAPEIALPPVVRAGVADRAVVLTFTPDLARRALDMDPTMLVSMLVTSPQDLARCVQLAAGRRFVAYVPRTAKPGLFVAAHQAGALVLTDLLGKGGVVDAMAPAQAAQWARALPLDILVTNTPMALQAELGAGGGHRTL